MSDKTNTESFYPEKNNMSNQRKLAEKEYMTALKEGAIILKDADPRPGMMTQEQEKAQNRIITAFLDCEDFYEQDFG